MALNLSSLVELFFGNVYMNQQDAQNSVIKLYFPLDALHVSDYVSPPFINCTSHLVYSDTSGCCAVLGRTYPNIPNAMYSL